MGTVQGILVPRQKGLYSSFPTFAEYKDNLVIFYRQGIKNKRTCHGLNGKVCSLTTTISQLEGGQASQQETKTVFTSDNELDAIISHLRDDLYVLATRNYVPGKGNGKIYLSVASSPDFSERREVEVKEKGVIIHAFYGKAFPWGSSFVFPAYGRIKPEELTCPILLVTDDFIHWGILTHLPTNIEGAELNESSVVLLDAEYWIFMRQDTPPFGIWYAKSADLQSWSKPRKLFSWAQAPMATVEKGEVALTFRDWLAPGRTGLSLTYPFGGSKKQIVASYQGNPYDGAYSDLALVDDKLLVMYYCGNARGEPSICYKLLDLTDK